MEPPIVVIKNCMSRWRFAGSFSWRTAYERLVNATFVVVLHQALPDLQRMKLCYSAAASSAPRSVSAWCD